MYPQKRTQTGFGRFYSCPSVVLPFKLVAGIRKLSNVRDCHLTLQKAPSILSLWRYFFLAVHAVSCYLFCFLYSNPGI